VRIMNQTMSLLERATVKFPAPKTKVNVEEILDDISKGLSIRVRYTFQLTQEIDRGNYKIVGLGMSGALYGGAKHIERGVNIMEFGLYRDVGTNTYTVFDGLKFELTPGFDESEIGQGQLEIMDWVRQRHGV